MLTDADLTRDLRVAFHDAAADLTYDGPVPTVRATPLWGRIGMVTLPAAAAVAAAAVVVGGSAPDAPTPPPSAAPSAPPSTAPSSAGEVVTEEFQVMGMTLSYERGLSEQPISFTLASPASVPEGASEVDFPEMDPARAWVTTDGSGEAVLYLKAPTRNEGRLMSLTAPGAGLSEQDMVDLLKGVG
ncbi:MULTISPECIES: hypothetical protein [unclassified Nocardioides]|uniref:hypothetical protein n=1 Tax=unclassified Nocardioides TaxID=2615069 RepID=UPI00301554B9